MPTNLDQPTTAMGLDMGDPTNQGTAAQFHPHHRNEKFVLAVHPQSWDIIDGEFLPSVRHMVIAPGSNGTDHRGNSTAMQAGCMQNGWVVLRPTDPRVGPYGIGTKVRGGVHWHTKWTELRSRNGQKLPHRIDWTGFNNWRRSLVSSGVVDPPDPEVMELKRALLVARLNRRADAPGVYGQRQLRRAEDSLDNFDSADPPGVPSKKAKGSLLCGNAHKDRLACDASDDVDALKAALKTTTHVTVERVIRARLVKLGD